MMVGTRRAARVAALTVALAGAGFWGGCKKSVGDATPAPEAAAEGSGTVVIRGGLEADGKMGPDVLKQIEAKSSASDFGVTFVRCRITDVTLDQLAKFPKLKRVEAKGSQVSPAAIERLKKAAPGVEVVI